MKGAFLLKNEEHTKDL